MVALFIIALYIIGLTFVTHRTNQTIWFVENPFITFVILVLFSPIIILICLGILLSEKLG